MSDFVFSNNFITSVLEDVKSKIKAVAIWKSNGSVQQITSLAMTVSDAFLQIAFTIPNLGSTVYVNKISIMGLDYTIGTQSDLKIYTPNEEAVVYTIVIDLKQFVKNKDNTWREG